MNKLLLILLSGVLFNSLSLCMSRSKRTSGALKKTKQTVLKRKQENYDDEKTTKKNKRSSRSYGAASPARSINYYNNSLSNGVIAVPNIERNENPWIINFLGGVMNFLHDAIQRGDANEIDRILNEDVEDSSEVG